MCNCVILDVTVKKILITAFLKKLPFLAKGLPQWHITFDLKQVALKFQKPLADVINCPSFQMYFKYYKIIGCHGNLVKCRNVVT